jgi:hypothetical protein
MTRLSSGNQAQHQSAALVSGQRSMTSGAEPPNKTSDLLAELAGASRGERAVAAFLADARDELAAIVLRVQA